MERPSQIRTHPAARTSRPSGSILNAVAILESFDQQNSEQTLSQISRRLGIPKATALRNLAALEQSGYLKRGRLKNTFALGAKVLELSRRFTEQNELLALARPVLVSLAAETGETAHLGVLSGTDIIYLEIAESPQRVRACVERGDRLPAHCVASGKAILAYSDSDVIDRVVNAGLKRLSKATITSPEELHKELEATRSRGFGLNLGEWLDEVIAVSAPVFSDLGQAVAAVGIAAPRSRLEASKARTLGSRVRAHADHLSAKLGAPTCLDRAV
jgi:IclR family transcriptional regulator, KDG regulon repressor